MKQFGTTLFLGLALVSSLPVSAQEISEAERSALVQVFLSTGGPGWEEIDGWGTDSSPCTWYGVFCGYAPGVSPGLETVVGVNLPINGLRGEFPCALTELPNLDYLDLRYNELTGIVPETYLDRWDRNEMTISLEGNRFSNLVESVDLKLSSSGLLCGYDFDSRFRFQLSEKGGAVYEAVRCAQEGETVCRVKEGEGPSLARLASALRRIGFQTLRSDHSYAYGFATHQTYVTTTIRWGDGTQQRLETYGGQSPIEAYIVEQMVLGLLQEVEWNLEYEKKMCSFQAGSPN